MTPSAELAEQHLIDADSKAKVLRSVHAQAQALIGIGYALLAVADAIREAKT